MSVVIDQVVGRMEPEAGPAVDQGRSGEAAPSREAAGTSLRRQLETLESRRLRLLAD
jgi:hypothetical protein